MNNEVHKFPWLFHLPIVSNDVKSILKQLNLPFNGAFDETDWVDRLDKNFLGGGDDFCSVGEEETAPFEDPFESRFSEIIEKDVIYTQI